MILMKKTLNKLFSGELLQVHAAKVQLAALIVIRFLASSPYYAFEV